MVNENNILKNIITKYPILGNYDYRLKLSQEKKSEFGGGLEFFNPNEPTNPFKGYPTVEVYDPSLQGEDLENAVFGDMLHYLPQVDKKYSRIKDIFINSMTLPQMKFAKERYKFDIKNYGEKRPFVDWFDMVWSDALIRGYIAPDKNDEFRKKGAYNKEQENILETLRMYLQAK